MAVEGDIFTLEFSISVQMKVYDFNFMEFDQQHLLLST